MEITKEIPQKLEVVSICSKYILSMDTQKKLMSAHCSESYILHHTTPKNHLELSGCPSLDK